MRNCMEESPWETDSRTTGDTFPAFYATPISLLCSQKPANGTYHESDKFSPHSHNLFFKIQF